MLAIRLSTALFFLFLTLLPPLLLFVGYNAHFKLALGLFNLIRKFSEVDLLVANVLAIL